MKKVLSFFVKRPFYANIIIAFILIVGGLSLAQMKLSFFPDITETQLNIAVAYPGASPKEMEEGITTRIEESIRGIAGIKYVNSTSSENFSNTVITTTGKYDIDESLMEVKNAVDGIASFPVDAERPIVTKIRNRTMACFIGLRGDIDPIKLKSYADEIENDLYNSGVMSQIAISGYPQLEISVEVSEANLLRYNLTFDEVLAAVSRNNLDLSGGQIRSDEEEIMIRSRYRTVDPDKIKEIIIRGKPDGTYITVGDVGTVLLQFQDVANRTYNNGVRSVSININKLAEEDLQDIVEFCEAYATKFNLEHDDAELKITYNFLVMLNARLQLLINNGGFGLILILLILGLFLSWRLSFWVAFGIPASFLAMFIVAGAYGVTINMISLFGMILVIGILVDDGIVIAENVYTHFQKGKTAKQAAIDGTMEVMPAVVTSVLTTIIAFSPLFFIEGRMSFMFEMAFVVVFSLFFSLFEAFLVLPAHLGSNAVLRKKKNKSKGDIIRGYLDKGLGFLRERIYGKVLRFVIKWNYIATIVPIALVLITVGLFSGGLIKSTFFPSIPFDQFNVNLAFKPGSGEKQTMEYLKNMDAAIWEVNEDLKEEFNDTTTFVEYTFVGLGTAFNGQERGSHAGNIFVMLYDLESKDISSFDIVKRVQKKIGEVREAEKFSVSGRNTFGTPVSVSLQGKNFSDLEAANEILMDGLHKIEEINNINNVTPVGMQEVLLKLKQKAYFLGFNQASLTNQVRQGFYGGQAQRLQKGKDELRVWVRYPKTDRVNIGQLEEMRIKAPNGAAYPLKELATYDISRGPVSINHYNGNREVRIEADMVNSTDPVPPIIERITNEILPIIASRYPSVTSEFQGQQRDSDETQGQIGKFFMIAFAFMFLIIIIHFQSVSQAFIIVAMIPLGWLGGLWGHGVEGIPVSMLSAWGLLALSGVIINDAVVFLSKFNSLLKEGILVKDAVYQTGMARFRAIVLTTITTTAGLYPIILETSFQAQFLKPMAVALAYGVLVGTAFILVFFPILILLLNDMKRVYYGGRRKLKLWVALGDELQEYSNEELEMLRSWPTREEVEKVVRFAKRDSVNN